MVVVIDGKRIAKEIREELKKRVEKLKEKNIKPTLAIILVGNNPASILYISNKQKAAREVGIECIIHKFSEEAEEEEVLDSIQRLNEDEKIHGIIVQLPLPKHLNEQIILDSISPEKDVDGLTPFNAGNLSLGNERIAPCTPKGIIKLLEKMNIEVEGKNVVIVNNSNVVGKPLALMLTNRFATVTLCHVKTKDLKEHTKKADILITATGVPCLIKADMVKEGAVVIDAGIKYSEKRIEGDVDFENVKKKASYITPVPGGVGPMTVAMVLENTLILAESSVEVE